MCVCEVGGEGGDELGVCVCVRWGVRVGMS